MNKRKLIIGLWSSVIFASLTSGLLASVAWFATANDVKVEVTGSVVEEYFHCGNGTEQDPFVITRPIHYYHLVEFFQRETALPLTNTPHFGRDYLYFQVGYDLDDDGDLEVFSYDNQGIYEGTFESPVYSTNLNMSYYSGTNALMPIGTNEVPFIGSFDGKASDGISISNITIHCSETVLVGNTSTTRTASDIGIFGYVADADSNSNPTLIKNAKFNGVTIDLTNVSATVKSSTTNVTHVENHNGTAYVGYIAGHVHTYTNYVNANTPATPLHDVYVSNATIQGGAGVHCDFGYIGLVDTVDGNAPTSIETQVTNLQGGPGGGQGDNWGGSIAFDAFNQRLYHHLNPGTSVRYKNGNTTYSKGLIKTYTNSSSSITVHRGGTASDAATYLSKDPATNYVVYNMIGAGTHKIYQVTSGSGTVYTADQSVNGTYEPLLVNNDYSTADLNTGYLTSSNYAYGTGHYTGVDGTVRSASYPNGQIGNSIDDTYHTIANLYNSTTGGPIYTYNGNKLEILTNGVASYSNSNYRLISDDYNTNHSVTNSALSGYTKTNYQTLGLTRYQSARAQLESVLTSSQYVHGIHFMGVAPDANSTVNVPNAIINGQAKTNYPVLLSSVDFNVKEPGYITLFAGAYYPATNSTEADSFFDLFKVNRNNDDSISSIQKIYKIYKDSSNNYTYTTTANQTVSGSTLMFDLDYLRNKPPKNNVAYYFEIPVDAGEYAIGAVSGKTAGAYLMYLDIGTNGEEQTPTVNQTIKVADVPLFTQIDFQTNSFVVNSCFNVSYIIPSGATKSNFSVTISCVSVTYESHAYTCYKVVINNATGNNFVISALLMDNDSDPNNDYYYMYEITYNGGTPTKYLNSNTYSGGSGTSMTPVPVGS